MSITTGTILRVVASMLFTDGNVAQMIFNAVVTGGGSPFDDADIVDDALDWVETMVANLTASVEDTLEGNEVIVYKYDAIDDDWDEVGTASWTWAPAGAGDPLPRGVAALINCRTSDPDVNGKKYVPGIGEGNLTESSWTGGTVTLLANFADDWVTGFVGAVSAADWVPGVWSPTRTNFFAMSGDYIIPTEPAYQRRRKRGVGA